MKYLEKYFGLFKEGWLTSNRFQFVVMAIFFVVLVKFLPYKIVVVGSKSIEVGIYYLNELVDTRERGKQYCFDNYRPDWVHPSLKIHSHQVSCKYLIGMPGDEISIDGDDILITYVENDVLFGERLVVKRFTRMAEVNGNPVGHEDLPSVIPAGSYYFGSDFNMGWDSRYVGLIDDELVIGKAKLLKAF